MRIAFLNKSIFEPSNQSANSGKLRLKHNVKIVSDMRNKRYFSKKGWTDSWLIPSSFCFLWIQQCFTWKYISVVVVAFSISLLLFENRLLPIFFSTSSIALSNIFYASVRFCLPLFKGNEMKHKKVWWVWFTSFSHVSDGFARVTGNQRESFSLWNKIDNASMQINYEICGFSFLSFILCQSIACQFKNLLRTRHRLVEWRLSTEILWLRHSTLLCVLLCLDLES